MKNNQPRPNRTMSEEMRSKSMNSQERNQQKLAPMPIRRVRGEMCKPLTKEQREGMISSYKDDVFAKSGFADNASEMEYQYKAYDGFVAKNKKAVNIMVREFEIRKKAAQYRDAKISATGKLNMDKLHEYRYNEDIFNRAVKLPQGKNHGMFMLIDYSGSMAGAT